MADADAQPPVKPRRYAGGSSAARYARHGRRRSPGRTLPGVQVQLVMQDDDIGGSSFR